VAADFAGREFSITFPLGGAARWIPSPRHEVTLGALRDAVNCREADREMAIDTATIADLEEQGHALQLQWMTNTQLLFGCGGTFMPAQKAPKWQARIETGVDSELTTVTAGSGEELRQGVVAFLSERQGQYRADIRNFLRLMDADGEAQNEEERAMREDSNGYAWNMGSVCARVEYSYDVTVPFKLPTR
jgi:hypothetical protein